MLIVEKIFMQNKSTVSMVKRKYSFSLLLPDVKINSADIHAWCLCKYMFIQMYSFLSYCT